MTSSSRSNLRAFGFAAALGMATLSAVAAAQTKTPTVNCYDATLRPNLVYVAGSSAVKPFLSVVAGLLAAETTPWTIVYQAQGSCTGVKAIFSANSADHLMFDIPAANGKPANYAVFFNADGSSQECFLDAAGDTVTVGVSDVYADTCGMSAPAGVTIGAYEGPIQPMTLVVPAASTQKNISAEAGYIAFGTGADGGTVGPWSDPQLYFIRNAASGTQQMISRAIGVPAAQWWGVNRGSSDAVRNQLKTIVDQATADKAIGILSVDLADAERANLRILAFQGYGQTCGYWPDSTQFSTDKANVRNGRYLIWGPVHFYAPTSGGVPSTAAAELVTRFASARLDQPLLDAIIKKHLVPKCAMKVSRSSEMGPLAPFSTDARCGCYFDKAANGATSCTPCSAPADCPSSAPACSYGYCENP